VIQTIRTMDLGRVMLPPTAIEAQREREDRRAAEVRITVNLSSSYIQKSREGGGPRGGRDRLRALVSR
jgi:hypothetical protein